MSSPDAAMPPNARPLAARFRTAAAGLGLSVVALLLVLLIPWSHRFANIEQTATFVVGPIDPASAVEQSFVNPTNFLNGLTVAIRRKEDDREVKTLIFRLRRRSDDGALLREGRVAAVPDPSTTTSLVDWRFPTITGMKGQDLDVQISLDPAAAIPIEFPVSQADPIDGFLRTNGIATDGRIDLLLAPVREARGLGVLRVLLRDGLLLRALVIVAPALWFAGLLALIRYAPGAAAVRIGRSLPIFAGLIALTVAALLAVFSDGPAPERHPFFWTLGLLSGLPAAALPIYRLGPVLRRTRTARAAQRLAVATAWPWRVAERQTLSRLPRSLAAPTRLILRMAVLATLVIALQISLVGTYQDVHFREKSDLDAQTTLGLDILYFGDSSVFYATAADADKRSTAAMLDALLPDERVFPVAQVAYHPGVYLDFIRYLDRHDELPETVIVPLHVGVFYESLLLGTPYDRQRIVLRLAGTPLESFTRARLVFSDVADSLDRIREYVAAAAGTTEYDPIPPDNPRLLQAVELAEFLLARGVRPIFYVTPLNIAPANQDLSDELHRVTSANARFIRDAVAATGATVIDLVDDLEPGYFSNRSPEQFLYGHLDQRGRAYIAERLAAAIGGDAPR